ncbi:serine hydrolase domain-containing protein [Micromonospora siamensis]|uniref:CubicO group peptidase, beta-lactamase class C family n=1 Tax=Micromonospora siamensis TaxID=299152 RepID=A0A1C5JA94_9ACTN|nr:serine hydrolase domain-containing protein [Micromonospora siamensis]SCG67492.1 CubicO group peptidase, beta-lactamase class C family [Micromonospora siamensis]
MHGQARDEAVSALVRDAVDTDGFSGVVLVGRAGAVLHAEAVGLANRTWQVPNRMDTRFRVASVSKMFTAVAVLQLVQRGRIGLTDRIVDLLGLTDVTVPPDVTVEHLLTMTAGIADWFDETGDWEANWAELLRRQPIYLLRDNADYLPLFTGKPPRFPAGERHEYNGACYLLLGLLVERLTGAPFAEHLRDHVFRPAGMRHTDLVALDDVAPGVAEGYLPVRDDAGAVAGWRRNVYSTTPAPAADGGATSTAADLVAFTEALRTGTLLDPAFSAAMLAPRVAEHDGKVRGYRWRYGFGVMSILDDDGAVVRWGHTGEEDGVSARLYHYPDSGTDVAILANTSWSAGSLAWGLHDLLVDGSVRKMGAVEG